MFSKNDKISKRQIFRLLSYDILGVGTLLLPSIIAKLNGTHGWAAILFGLVLGLIFCLILTKVAMGMKRDESYPDYLKRTFGKWIGTFLLVCYSVYYLWLAGYGTFVFGRLIQTNLLKEQSYYGITAGILVLAIYGMIQGVEGRARIYEILFWFLMIPLFLMLLLAVRNVDTNLLFPVFMTNVNKNFFMGGYFIFSIFSVISFLLFLVPYTSDMKKIKQGSLQAVLFAGAVLLILYEVLLGIFGTKGMAGEDYPAVTLMSMVQIPGGFLERQDAFMVAIWFFTVFAFISSSLFYLSKLWEDIGKIKGKKSYMVLWGVLVYLLSFFLYRFPGGREKAVWYYFAVGIPFTVLIPVAAGLLGWRKNRKHKTRKS